MTPEQQRYEVSQLIAEGRERGYPTLMIVIACGIWFDRNGIASPVSLLNWLAEDSPGISKLPKTTFH